MTKISIIIPMYNVEKYINKCVSSTFKQDLKESEFEIILVNDESPDNSLELANNLKANYSNITIVSQKNKGLGGARNTGIKQAKGDYLLFLDADDFYLDNSIIKIITIAKKNNLDILEFGAQGVDKKGNIIYQYQHSSSPNILSGIEYYNTQKTINSACNKLYNRKFILQNELFFIEKIFGEDFEFNTRSLYYANKIMSIDFIVTNFLQSDNSITRSNNLEKKIKYLNDLISILRKINALFISCGIHKNEGHDAFFKKRMTVINIDIFYMMMKNNFLFSDIKNTKYMLKKENIFYVRYTINDIKKDIFRTIFLNFNFFFFRILVTLKRLI
tara:strand:- start:3821 stop:4810 length:990 start_codon:yes stop_codon:yes gene_type:complete